MGNYTEILLQLLFTTSDVSKVAR